MLVIVMNSLLMQLLSTVPEKRQRGSPDGVNFNYVCICISQIHLKLPPLAIHQSTQFARSNMILMMHLYAIISLANENILRNIY